MTQALGVLVTALALVLPGVFVQDAGAEDGSGRFMCSTDQNAVSGRVVTAEFRSETDRHDIVPVTGKPAPSPAAPRLPQGTVNGLQAVRSKASAMTSQVKSLQADLNQPAWRQAIQPQLASLRATLAALQQDVTKLQAVNRNANMNVGIQIANALQARAQELGRALDGLAQARDATAARGAVGQISASLGGIVKTANDPPGCCQALTCCAIGIR